METNVVIHWFERFCSLRCIYVFIYQLSNPGTLPCALMTAFYITTIWFYTNNFLIIMIILGWSLSSTVKYLEHSVNSERLMYMHISCFLCHVLCHTHCSLYLRSCHRQTVAFPRPFVLKVFPHRPLRNPTENIRPCYRQQSLWSNL